MPLDTGMLHTTGSPKSGALAVKFASQSVFAAVRRRLHEEQR